MVGATIGYAIPNFILSILFILVVGLYLHLLPLGGWGSPSQVVLPALALGLPWASFVARLTRGTVIGSAPAGLHPHRAREGRRPGARPRAARVPKRADADHDRHRAADRRADHGQPRDREHLLDPRDGPVPHEQRPRLRLHDDARPDHLLRDAALRSQRRRRPRCTSGSIRGFGIERRRRRSSPRRASRGTTSRPHRSGQSRGGGSAAIALRWPRSSSCSSSIAVALLAPLITTRRLQRDRLQPARGAELGAHHGNGRARARHLEPRRVRRPHLAASSGSAARRSRSRSGCRSARLQASTAAGSTRSDAARPTSCSRFRAFSSRSCS